MEFSNHEKVDSRWGGVKQFLMRARMANTTTTVGCTTKRKACRPSLSTFPMSVFLQIMALAAGAAELGNKSCSFGKVAQQEERRTGGRGAVKSGYVRLG